MMILVHNLKLSFKRGYLFANFTNTLFRFQFKVIYQEHNHLENEFYNFFPFHTPKSNVRFWDFKA